MQIALDGKAAYVYTAGHAPDPALPSMLFIHGGAQDHSAWALQSRYFAYHRHNAVVPDLPAHGRSAGPALESVEAMADWVTALLDALRIPTATLIGHSMGSLVALEVAARVSARVAGIALLGSSAPMPVTEALLDAARANDPAALAMVNIWSHSSRAQVGGNTIPGMWMLASNLRLLERQAPGVLYADFAACNSYAHGAAAASRVACPALLISGTRDQMTPPRATLDLAQMIPHARTVMLDGSGHALMAEQPDAVLDALIVFSDNSLGECAGCDLRSRAPRLRQDSL